MAKGGPVVATKQAAGLDFQDLVNGERFRTYVFKDGTMTIENVVRVCARPSGTHRLETADKKKWIIPSGWLGLMVDADEWSV